MFLKAVVILFKLRWRNRVEPLHNLLNGHFLVLGHINFWNFLRLYLEAIFKSFGDDLVIKLLQLDRTLPDFIIDLLLLFVYKGLLLVFLILVNSLGQGYHFEVL